MFEKEAKVYAERTKTEKELKVLNTARDWGIESLDLDERRLFAGIQDREKAREQGFREGAEFGYNRAFVEADKNLKAIVTDFNKANKWHYVKDELPRKSDTTLCELMPVFVAVKAGYNVSTYGTYWNLRLGKFECLDEVYAWCYAPEPPELPKEIKEND